tara:strand:+ start:1534 stop:2046 length:513 start_codon:yes stop_codon:yes gene_type:complete
MTFLEKYLQKFGKKVLHGAKKIAKDKKYNFADKLKVKVRKVEGGYEVEFIGNEYTEFVDKGVSGKKKTRYYKDYKNNKRKSPYQYKDKAPPSSIFEKWIKRKGIKGRDKNTGRFITRKSLSFIMAKSMQMKGRDGVSFLQKPVNLEMKKMNKEIAKAIKNDMYNLINNKK